MTVAHLELTFECTDPAFLGHFWAGVTGYRTVVQEPDRVCLDGGSLGVGRLVFIEVDGWKTAENRVRPDLVVDDLEGELERLVGLGAVVAEIGSGAGSSNQERIATLRDPEGNEFTLNQAA